MFINLGDLEARISNINMSDEAANTLIESAVTVAGNEIRTRLNQARALEKNYSQRQNASSGG